MFYSANFRAEAQPFIRHKKLIMPPVQQYNFYSNLGGHLLFRCVGISIRGLVRPLVGRLVGPSVMLLSKSLKNGLLWILNDLDSAGRGKKRGEEGGTRGKRDK